MFELIEVNQTNVPYPNDLEKRRNPNVRIFTVQWKSEYLMSKIRAFGIQTFRFRTEFDFQPN